MRALGRGSSTVAPLRVELRPTPWLREAATSCGGRRRLLRLLRPCTIAESRVSSDLSVADNVGAPRGQCPQPARDWAARLWSQYVRVIMACNLREGPAREGRAGLAWVTAQGLRPFSLGAPRRGACEAPPIRHGTAVTPSPPGKAFLLRALGRDSPTVAPLRVELRPPPWLREAATSCGGRRRLLRLLRPWGRYGCISIAHTGTNSILLRSTS